MHCRPYTQLRLSASRRGGGSGSDGGNACLLGPEKFWAWPLALASHNVHVNNVIRADCRLTWAVALVSGITRPSRSPTRIAPSPRLPPRSRITAGSQCTSDSGRRSSCSACCQAGSAAGVSAAHALFAQEKLLYGVADIGFWSAEMRAAGTDLIAREPFLQRRLGLALQRRVNRRMYRVGLGGQAWRRRPTSPHGRENR